MIETKHRQFSEKTLVPDVRMIIGIYTTSKYIDILWMQTKQCRKNDLAKGGKNSDEISRESQIMLVETE